MTVPVTAWRDVEITVWDADAAAFLVLEIWGPILLCRESFYCSSIAWPVSRTVLRPERIQGQPFPTSSYVFGAPSK